MRFFESQIEIYRIANFKLLQMEKNRRKNLQILLTRGLLILTKFAARIHFLVRVHRVLIEWTNSLEVELFIILFERLGSFMYLRVMRLLFIDCQPRLIYGKLKLLKY